MMASTSPRIPSYRLHKPTGLGVVRLGGRDYYLGKHGTRASEAEYRRLLAEWLASNSLGLAAQAEPEMRRVTIHEIFVAYWQHAVCYYVKDGSPTTTQQHIRLAVGPLCDLYGPTPAGEFGPLRLKAVRDQMVRRHDWSRSMVNKSIGIIKRMFKWAVENELVPASVLHGLQAVTGLRRGRSEAREMEPVKPVPEADVNAVLPFVSPQVRAMIQLQMLTGMRPGEVAAMRGGDLDTTGRIWVYQPASHKTQHHGKERLIYLGPKAQAIVRQWLRNDLSEYLFSPMEAEQHRCAKRRRMRKTPMTPSQARRQRKGNPQVTAGDHYRKDSYRRAIQRGCDLAFPLPAALAPQMHEPQRQWWDRLTQEQRAEVKAWRRSHHWHPNQLRHNAATFLRKQYGLDAARVILGHSSPVVTEVYAELDHAKAMQIMAEVG